MCSTWGHHSRRQATPTLQCDTRAEPNPVAADGQPGLCTGDPTHARTRRPRGRSTGNGGGAGRLPTRGPPPQARTPTQLGGGPSPKPEDFPELIGKTKGWRRITVVVAGRHPEPHARLQFQQSSRRPSELRPQMPLHAQKPSGESGKKNGSGRAAPAIRYGCARKRHRGRPAGGDRLHSASSRRCGHTAGHGRHTTCSEPPMRRKSN